MSSVLEIDKLKIAVDGFVLLNGIDLKINKGKIHAVMGPNGAGKSSLALALAGKDGYELISGKILYQGEDLSALAPYERARRGLFTSFQNPIDLPGVRIMSFLQLTLNARREALGLDKIKPSDFLKLVSEKALLLNMTDDMLKREVNVGFSGGERKRFEALQMLLCEPNLAILDEIDSGLDIDAMKWVAKMVNHLKAKGMAVLLITHYKRLLELIPPDEVHILQDGRIVKSGNRALAQEIEREGYASVV